MDLPPIVTEGWRNRLYANGPRQGRSTIQFGWHTLRERQGGMASEVLRRGHVSRAICCSRFARACHTSDSIGITDGPCSSFAIACPLAPKRYLMGVCLDNDRPISRTGHHAVVGGASTARSWSMQDPIVAIRLFLNIPSVEHTFDTCASTTDRHWYAQP